VLCAESLGSRDADDDGAAAHDDAVDREGTRTPLCSEDERDQEERARSAALAAASSVRAPQLDRFETKTPINAVESPGSGPSIVLPAFVGHVNADPIDLALSPAAASAAVQTGTPVVAQASAGVARGSAPAAAAAAPIAAGKSVRAHHRSLSGHDRRGVQSTSGTPRRTSWQTLLAGRGW
jgi:hypothetical protein